MSLKIFSFSFLAIKPKIWMENGELYGRTSLISQIFSLFSYCKHLYISPKAKIIEIEKRKCWFLQDIQRISFADISHIDYEFSSVGTSWGFDGLSLWARQDQMESYTVSLVLKNHNQIPLFSFSGEGSVETGWLGVILGGDSIIDLEGDQGQKSREFSDILSHLIGVPIGEPMSHLADEQGDKFFCKKCHRPLGPTSKRCIYCGGEPYIPDKPGVQVKAKKQKARCIKCKHLMDVKQKKCMYCQGNLEIVEV